MSRSSSASSSSAIPSSSQSISQTTLIPAVSTRTPTTSTANSNTIWHDNEISIITTYLKKCANTNARRDWVEFLKDNPQITKTTNQLSSKASQIHGYFTGLNAAKRQAEGLEGSGERDEERLQENEEEEIVEANIGTIFLSSRVVFPSDLMIFS